MEGSNRKRIAKNAFRFKSVLSNFLIRFCYVFCIKYALKVCFLIDFRFLRCVYEIWTSVQNLVCTKRPRNRKPGKPAYNKTCYKMADFQEIIGVITTSYDGLHIIDTIKPVCHSCVFWALCSCVQNSSKIILKLVLKPINMKRLCEIR